MTEITGTLPVGIEYNGAILKDFTITHTTAGTEMDAADMCVNYGKNTNGAIVMARLAAVTRIEGLPQESLDIALMRKMAPKDIDALSDAKSELDASFTPLPVVVA